MLDSIQETASGKFVTIPINGKKSKSKCAYAFDKQDTFFFVVTFKAYSHGEIKRSFNTSETLESLWHDFKNNKSDFPVPALKNNPQPIVKPLNPDKVANDQIDAQNALNSDLELFKSLPSTGISDYLEIKGLLELKSKCLRYGKGFIMLAITNILTNKPVGFQKIYDNGDKRFTKGLTKHNSAIVIDGDSSVIAICEGFASGATINKAMGCLVYCALDAGNIESVANSIKQLYSEQIKEKTVSIVIYADNDSRKPADKNKENTGIIKAYNAALKNRFDLTYPLIGDYSFEDLLFPNEQIEKVDFNDLLVRFDIETVASQIEENRFKPKVKLSIETKQVETETPVETPESNEAEAEKPLKEWQNELKKLVDSFNETHAQVLIGGKHRIMIKIDAANSPNKRDTYEFVAQPELERIYQNTQIKTEETPDRFTGKIIAKYANHIKAWATDSNCRLYKRGTIFKPLVDNKETISNDYFNTWQGYAVKPKEGDWSLIKYHIEEIICSGKTDLMEYFYNWVAFIFQNPDQPAGAAVVLRGLKGVGKGMIANFLMFLWGNHALHITSAKHLVGSFNGHFNDICFVYADEAFFSGDKQHEGVLKGLITEKNLVIERKGIDATQQPNYLKVFMLTNNDYAVPASKDERRYFVLDVSEEKKGDIEYFKSLSNDINDKEIQAAFLHDMLKRDIRDFHTGQIPETIGLKEQRYHSLDSAGKWVVDCLERGYFILTVNGEWINDICTEDLHKSYLEYCKDMKVSHYDMKSQTILSKYLKTLFKKKLVGVGRKAGFDVGTVDEAIARVELIEKINIGKD